MRPLYWPPKVSGHAMRRYQEQWPEAKVSDVLYDVARGEVIDPGVVAALTQYGARADGTSVYVSGTDFKGIFVLVPAGKEETHHHAFVMVTYLRLEESQRRILRG